MRASAAVSAPRRPEWWQWIARRGPAVLAVVLVLLGVIALAVRLDAPADGTMVSSYQADGVTVDVPGSDRRTRTR